MDNSICGAAIRKELSVLRAQVRLQVILSVKSLPAVLVRTFVGFWVDMHRFYVSPQGESAGEPVAISAAKPATVVVTAGFRSCIMSTIEPTDTVSSAREGEILNRGIGSTGPMGLLTRRERLVDC